MSNISDQNISPNIITPLKHPLLKNHLLSALLIAEYQRLFPFLALVKLELNDVIYESGSKLLHVYFPVDAIISLTYVMESGSSAGNIDSGERRGY